MLSPNIQKAVDIGLLQVENGRITAVNKEATETVFGISRIVQKLQPTTVAEMEDTQEQEAIILCRVLTSPSGLARELWSQLRTGLGVAHDQAVPNSLWSSDVFKAIGGELDAVYRGERNAELLTRQSLITHWEQLPPNARMVDIGSFADTVNHLSGEGAMDAFGDGESEWGVALDLLRQARVKAIYDETMSEVDQVKKADTKMEKIIEHQQSKLMECLGMLRGSVGQQGNAKNMGEMFYGVNGQMGLIDKVMTAERNIQPVSTTIDAMDVDMEGGVYPPGSPFCGGRLFTLAARSGVGKTILGVNAALGLAKGGLKVGFVSAELDEEEIWTRVGACATRLFNSNQGGWVSVGMIKQPDDEQRETVALNLQNAMGALQETGGEILVESPWGADVNTVIGILRSMKAKNPDLRAAVVDHFHCLARHKNAPSNESSMMEDRAYKLMTCAKELGIDLIVLAQMNRVGMAEERIGGNKVNAPNLDQIRGTDALGHVSHAVWIVRRQSANEETGGNPERKLEFWHAKTRGRQATWKGSKVTGFADFIECSVLEMDYGYSAVREDNTLVAHR